MVYSAQNLDKRLPLPFRWLQRRVLGGAAGISVCNAAAGALVRRRGFPGVPDVIPLGVETSRSTPRSGSTTRTAADRVRRPARRPQGRGRPPRRGGRAAVRDPGGRRCRTGGDRAPTAGGAARPRREGAVRGLAQRCGPRPVLPGLDVLAVPSAHTAGWVEQFGRVAVEAMAEGTPVVASDSGALPDVVGGAGVLVAPGEVEPLRTALARLLGDRRCGAGVVRPASGVRANATGRPWPTAISSCTNGPRTRCRRTAGAERRVEVVVVAYGAPDPLRRALAPLDGMPVTVVDNSSSDDVRRVCSTAAVRYLDPGANLGFGAGVNVALADRLDPSADVLLLNPDAEISAVDVQRLHRALLADPGLASVGPHQVDETGAPARVGWPFPTPGRTWAEAAGLGRIASAHTDFAIGSVLLLRAEALRHVGGFDEQFFLYAEETDWAYRAHRLGWRHAVVPSVTAIHLGGATSTDRERRDAHFRASNERYLRKHYGTVGWQRARVGQLGGSAARALVLRGDKRVAARRRLVAYLRGPVRLERRYRTGVEPTTISAVAP